MARKDHDSSMRDRCDICGTALDDDSVIQEFPDGSVVRLCARCASGPAHVEETAPGEDIEASDATEEWSKPHHEDPTVPAPPHFEAETFDFDEPRATEPPVKRQADDLGIVADGATRAEAELAAWASASSGDQQQSDVDDDYDDEYDEQEAEEAALQLVAAIAEANMAEDGQSLPETGSQKTEAELQAEAEEQMPQVEREPQVDTRPEVEERAPRAEVATGIETTAIPEPGEATVTPQVGDRTKEELLVPMADLIALQNEMQSALAKLSSTLEHFVADMELTSRGDPATNDLVRQLEDDLESTRERLRLAGTLLPDAAAAMAAATATTDSDLVSHPAASTTAAPGLMAPPPLPTPPPLPKVTAGAIVPPPLPRPAAAGAAVGAAASAAVKPPSLDKSPTPVSRVSTPPLSPSTSDKPVVTPQAAERKTAAVAQPPAEQAASDALPEEKTSKQVPGRREPAGPTPPPQDGSDATAIDDSAMLDARVTPPPPRSSETDMAVAASTAGPVAETPAAAQKLPGDQKDRDRLEAPPETEPKPAEIPGLTFKINEVQVAQRYFNDSEFVKKLSTISRSIGRPKANVSRTRAGVSEATITVFWDIVWYQYIVDLRKDLPADVKRVTMAQEGMDLQELEPRFTEKNAVINPDGRLDASELEVRLLSDPEALIANLEVSMPEDRLAEDATEEIWDQQSAPEFRWD